jgi:hypothetical protein
MSIDDITTEQNKLYEDLQEKEKELSKDKYMRACWYALTAFSAGGVGYAIANIALHKNSIDPVLIAVDFFIATYSVFFGIYGLYEGSVKIKQIEELKGEIDLIKSDPAYSDLSEIE